MKRLPATSSCVAAGQSIYRRSAIATCIAFALIAGPAYAQRTQLGTQSDPISPDSTAIGAHTTAIGDGSVAVGINATTGANFATAIGRYSAANALNSLALGSGATVQSGAIGSVALGAGSLATGSTLGSLGYLVGGTATSEVAIGGRRITGLVAGADDGDAATVGQLKALNQGWTVSVGGASEKIAAGDTLTFVGSKNAQASYDAATNQLTVSVVDAPVFAGKVTAGGGLLVGAGTTVDMGGNVVANVADGAVLAGSKQAVNGGQLYNVANTPITFAGNTGTKAVRLGETLSIQGGSATLAGYSGQNLRTSITGNTLDLLMSESPVFGGVTINAAGSGKLTGVANGLVAGASTEAVNGGQLYLVEQVANKGWYLSAGGEATPANIAPGGTADFAAGTNATVTRSGSTITTGVIDNPTFAGLVTTNGGLAVAAGGLTVAAGQTVNMGGNVLRNVGPGTSGLDAVNVNQLTTLGSQVATALGGTSAFNASTQSLSTVLDVGGTAYGSVNDALNAISTSAGLGWNLQADGGPVDNIGGGQTVNVRSGSNAIVTYAADTNALDVGVVDAPSFTGMVTAGGGFTVGAGQLVDMGANQVTNVGAGTIDAASTMAVNGAQIFGISQSVAQALGGDSIVNADGSVSGPSYALPNAATITGDSVAAGSVGEGFGKVDAALGTLQSSITNITDGSAGIRYFHVNSTAADSLATGGNAIAIGPEAIATQLESAAIGHGARAINGATTAVGRGAWAYGYQSTAVGSYADTRGDYSSAFGSALAFGRGTTALGAWAYAGGGFDWTGEGGSRPGNIVEIVNGTAVGFASVAAADNATAVGAEAEARGVGSLALGNGSNASASGSISIGQGAAATLDNSVALGNGAMTSEVVGTSSTVINGLSYDFAGAAPAGTVSVGAAGSERTITNVAAGRIEAASTDAVNGSQLYATNQAITAIGSVAGNANDLAVKYVWTDANADGVATPEEIDYGTVVLAGGEGTRISNLAPGVVAPGSMDAINGGQLFGAMTQVANYFGGGAAMTPQGLAGPSYLIQGQTYYNVGDALQALDASVTWLGDQPAGSQLAGYTHGQSGSDYPVYGDGGPGSTALGVNAHAAGVEDAVAVGESATVAADYGTAVGQGASATAENSVALGHGAVADRANTVSVGTPGDERQVVNVADATEGTDAINKRQLDRGVASANSYTDARVNALSDSFDVFQGRLDQRLRQQDRRIDRQGAMSAAMMNMAVSAAGIHTPNRVGIGVGFQGGESALSLGYQRAFSDRSTITFGGAFSSDDQAIGIGAGFGW